ncbi:M56 family metallopeptidase [Pedobacter sp.]|uniref:M56 family metallopeptidase n=1 Tax=Pedobacter sp. TaxID=1411316 RepID=UPI003D7F42E4
MMEALVNNIIKATGWSIFHSLWQGTLLYGLLLLTLLLLPKPSARMKHNLAFITMSMIFFCFWLTFFSVFTWPPLSSVSNSLAFTKVIPVSLGKQAEYYFPILVSIYGIGLLMQAVILTGGYYKLWKLKVAPKVSVPKEWQVLFQRITRELEISRNVKFYLSDQVSVPLVLGYLKPIILFPISFASQLEMMHVEAILIHEMAHIRRNDFLLNSLKTAMETILFFNPFTWLCSSMIEREREHACDDIVVQRTHTPLTYAHALLQIELINEKQTPVFTMAASGNNHNLYQRIKRITDMKTTYNTAKQQILAITVTVLTLVSLAWINPVNSKTTVKKRIVDIKATMETATSTDWAPLQDTLKKKKSVAAKKSTTVKKKAKPVPPPPPPATGMEMPAPPAPAPKEPVNLPVPPNPPAEDDRAMKEKVRKQAEEIRLYYQSPAWKKQEASLKRMAVDVQNHVKSEAWKQQVEKARKEGMAMAKIVNTPEFRKEIEKMTLQSRQLSMESKKLAEHFNSAAFKQQIQEAVAAAKEMQECVEEGAHANSHNHEEHTKTKQY